MYRIEWSSTSTANRRTPTSSETPFGTAHDAATPACSRRRSQCRFVAWCSWMTNLGIPFWGPRAVTVALVTDTTHYLPRALVAGKHIHEVSLYVKFEGRQVHESEL